MGSRAPCFPPRSSSSTKPMRNQAGFIMLAVTIIGSIFTFGLAALVIELISLIEGIIYLTKSQTDFDQIYVLHQRDWF